VRARVEAARQIQRERFAGEDHKAGAISNTVTCNADMRVAEIRKYCALDETSRSLMKTAMSAHAKHAMQLSARAYHRILKLARTIADLAGSESIGPSHLAELLEYRPRNLYS
jgi:magnesium chelatase family protein